MTLLAIPAIDLAIFATMGGLWVGGATFIVLVWRWIIRTEAERSESSPITSSPQA